MRAEVHGVEYPELPTAETVHDWWDDVGRCGLIQGSPIPLTWAELQAFAALSGADLRPYEAKCLVEMSRAYCLEITNTNPLRISPMERSPWTSQS
jgi:hypothetical protein